MDDLGVPLFSETSISKEWSLIFVFVIGCNRFIIDFRRAIGYHGVKFGCFIQFGRREYHNTLTSVMDFMITPVDVMRVVADLAPQKKTTHCFDTNLP